MIYYVYRSLSKQKTGKGKISFAMFQHFNIFASGSGPFFNYYMVPFLIIIYRIGFVTLISERLNQTLYSLSTHLVNGLIICAGSHVTGLRINTLIGNMENPFIE